jgi:hypothetical protein
MTRSKLWRVGRLEAVADRYTELQYKRFEDWRTISLFEHVIKVSALVAFGDPKPDEPLSEAWQRSVRTIAEDPSDRGNQHVPQGFDDQLYQLYEKLGKASSDMNLPTMFRSAIASAPLWLFTFTRADVSASLLRLTLPSGFADQIPGRDAVKEMRGWPNLPQCAFNAGGPMSPDEYRAVWTAQSEAERTDDTKHQL